MKYKKTLLVSILIFSLYICRGQSAYVRDDVSQKGFQKEKLFFGGNLGLSLGTFTYVNVSPLIGYRFSEMFAAGMQINGLYESRKYLGLSNTTIKKDRFGMVGLGLFGRIYPIPQIFLQIQPEVNYIMGKIERYNPPSSNSYHLTTSSFLAGGGYSQSLGGNSAFVLMVLFDVFQNDNSPYGSGPIFRAGVNVGF